MNRLTSGRSADRSWREKPDRMLRELRYAVRMLWKSPGFTIIAVLALALGIGASTTNFSSINAILLKPLPLMQDQERMVYVSEYFTKHPDQDTGISYPDYVEWKKQATTLEGVVAFDAATMIISDGEKPSRYLGGHISVEAFSLFGVQPIVGRQFRPEEEQLNAAPVALIGQEVWQNEFGGDRSIAGRVVTLNGKPTTIIGVMPKGWRFPEMTDIWMPLRFDEKAHRRGNFNLDGIAKLKPGVSIAKARAEMEAIQGRIAAEHPESNTGCSVHVKPMREELVEEVKKLMLLLMGAVLFVHLIACANVANLLLARGVTRSKEIAIRLALGASRGQIMRQLLTESVVLGFAGSVVGLLFAVWGVDLMVRAIPVEMPFWIRFDFDWRVFSFAIATGLLSSVAFGIFPALQASHPNLVDVLKEGGRSSSGSVKGQRVRSGLVVAEVALALVLLIGAGLMLRSFLKLQRTDVGVDSSSTLTFRVGLPPAQYPDEGLSGRFFEELIPKLRTLPGVESAGSTSSLPASGNIGIGAVVLEGEQEPKQMQDSRLMSAISITPGYLETSRIPLVRGRGFAAEDGKNAPRVALIDEEAAQRWFPGIDPVGHQLRAIEKPGEPPKWATIVGVVKRVVYQRLTSKRVYPVVYFAQYQNPEFFMSVVMRTKANPNSFASVARNAVLSVNKDIPIYKVLTLEEVVTQSFWERKFFGSLFTVFAGLALFLASLGLYGVMAYSVRQRTQEIGVRMALGAQSTDVLRLVTGHGVRLIGVGLAIGFIGAYFFAQLLAKAVEDVKPHDPVSFAIVPAVLFVVGLLACYLPARSAMRMDPVEALRYE